MEDTIVLEAGDSLADAAVALANVLQGSKNPDGLSRSELCDSLLEHVSAWWYLTTTLERTD